jgi:glycine cleavage system aminomethyltransferase T
MSPLLGAPIALGYVRREANGAGIELAVGAPDAACRATIVPLPFVGPLLA